MTKKHRDVIIIGGSAAGLSAGLVLARAQLDVLIIDAGAPRNAPAEHMHGYLTRDGLAPAKFALLGRDEVRTYGSDFEYRKVARVAQLSTGGFEVHMDNNEIETSRALLVGTGLSDGIPAIAGVKERWGTLVHHCPYCHGYEVLNQRIVVIDGASREFSIKQAGLLRRYSDHVDFLSNGSELSPLENQKLEAQGIRIFDSKISELLGDPHSLTGVAFEDGSTLECDAAFVGPEFLPNDRILKSLGCEINSNTNLVKVDELGQTSVSGVWAAGNVINPSAQVISSAGAGSTSAIAISGWLLEKDIEKLLTSNPRTENFSK